MTMGSGAIRLSEVCTEFGKKIDQTPRNLRTYLKCTSPAFLFNSSLYGVPEHENNQQVPSSGTLKLSHFRSGATKISQKYISNTCTADYVFNPDIFGGYTWFGRGFSTEQGLAGAFLPPFGGMSSIDAVGKSLIQLGQTTNIIGVYDYSVGTVFDPLYAFLAFAGDNRNSSWDQKFYSITVDISGVGRTTKYASESPYPNGFYDASYDATFWFWYSAFNFTASSSVPFTVEIELDV